MPKTLRTLHRFLDSRFKFKILRKTFRIRTVPPRFPHQALTLGISKVLIERAVAEFWPQPLSLSATRPQALSHSAALARVADRQSALSHSATLSDWVAEWLSGGGSHSARVAEWPGWMTSFFPLMADYLYGKTFRCIRNLSPAKFFTTHIVCGMTWWHLKFVSAPSDFLFFAGSVSRWC